MADNKLRLNLRQPGQEGKFNETVSNDYIRQPKKDNGNFNQPVNKKQNNKDDEVYDNYTREAVITGEDGQLADDIVEKVLSEKEQETKKILTYLKTTFLGKILYEQDENGEYIPGFYEIEDGTLERRFIPDRNSEEHKEVETITDVGFDGNHIYIQDNEVDRYRLNDPIRDPRIKKGLPPLNVTADDVEKLGKQVANRMGRAWNPSAPIMDVEIGHLRSNFMDGSVSPYGVTMAIRVSRASLALRNLADMADEEVEQLLATFMRCGLNLLISGPTGTGKATRNSDLIRTLKGIKTVGDVKVGDYLFDREGKPTRVNAVFPHKNKEVYRVTLKDGRTVDADAEHNWSVITHKKLKTARQDYRKLYKGREFEMTEDSWEEFLMQESNWQVITTEELIKDYVRTTKTKTGTNRSHFKYRVPQNGAVQYKEKELDVNPYVMGAFLGDGCLTLKALTLSSSDDFIVNKVAELIGSPEAVRFSPDDYGWVFRLPEDFDYDKHNVHRNVKNIQTTMILSEDLVGKCDTRFIPREYLESSIEQRYQLLQGLMDTDGSIRNDAGKRFNMEYTTTSERLRDDVIELIRSLGYQVTVSGKKRKGRKSEEYAIKILTSNKNKYKFFSLPRKLDIAETAKKHSEQRNEDVLAHNGNEYNFAKKYNTIYYDTVPIVKIEKLDELADMTCFTVDNKENLYLVGDFVVTHNTEMQQRLKQVNTGYIE